MLGKDRCVRLVALVALVALVLAGSLVPGSRIPGVAAAGNPFIGHNFITPLTGQDVRNTESSWQTTRPADAAALHVLDQTQVALWVTSGFTNSAAQSWVQQNVDYYDDPSRNGVPIIAPYALASPSCGGGGLTGTTYQSWINAIATGINGRRVVITLEPDSLLQFCSNQGDRQAGLSYAVSVFKQNPNATVYLDGAHYGSSLSSQASYLYNSNIAQADGFFVNSTLYDYVGDSVYYGEQLAQTLCSNVGVCGKHFVVDVSRSSRGNAFTGDTQNTRGRGLGAQPTTNTIDTNIVDAFLWIKPVWESDGGRSGDPGGGATWIESSDACAPTALYLGRTWLTPFSDMPSDPTTQEAIRQLWGRGILRGYNATSMCDPNNPYYLGPNDPALRVQMASLIDRAVFWEHEGWADYSYSDLNQSCVDSTGRQAILNLAHYGVTHGYGDGTFGPCDSTLNVQVPVFIARAMVAKGKWASQPDNPAYYPNITDSTLRTALATYIYYAGSVPGYPATSNWTNYTSPATRAWFALVLWQALQHV